ncbi:MAG: glutamate carboxypeptidase [Mycobacteriales bacterium]
MTAPAEMIELLRRLVEVDSPTGDPAACGLVHDVLAPQFAALGGAVERVVAADRRPVLLARWGAGPGPLLLGHVDTVFGPDETSRRPFAVAGRHARGPGVFDMKAGLVQLVFGLRELAAGGGIPALTVLLNADEEIGSPGSEPLIRAAAGRASCALVLEGAGPQGAVKSARKGIGLYRVEVDGVAAHSGLDPEKGVNAITELAGQLLDIEGLAASEAGTTVNVGVVAGGTGRNVVPAGAGADFETRFWTLAEGRRVDAALRRLRPRRERGAVRLSGGVHRQPMERTAQVARLVAAARRCAAADGWQVGEMRVGGVSDGNITAALGLPTLDGLGAEGWGAHTADEVADVAAMPRRARWLAGLVGAAAELFPTDPAAPAAPAEDRAGGPEVR